MIDWQKFPLRDVREILLHDFNSGKKIFDGDINSVVPRAQKSDDEKISRTRSIAEVFTPPEVVKQMVDALELEKLFWQTRVECRCLEAACGEAPFITTRYDAESGEEIPAAERVGILDRKFRAIPAADEKNFWATQAVQSCYGYELQGDSLLIARANVLLSFAEFVENFSADEIRDVAEIIAKNFWFMDGLKIPDAQGSLFDANEIKITDWRTGDEIFFKGDNEMKFDFLISNPPYQDDSGSGGNKTFASPLYHHFLREAPKVAEKSVLITPARFLFDAGATPKKFNRDMLDDPHFKVLDYAEDASKYFRNVDIGGGVAITFHDTTKNFDAIGTFIPWDELRSIHQKVCVANKNFKPLSEIIYSRKIFKLTEKFYVENPDAPTFLKDSNNYTIGSNTFVEMPEYFFADKPDDGHDYVKILGLAKLQRVYKWIRRDYVNAPAPFTKWKVFLPQAFGRSNLGDKPGQLISPPVVGEPNEGCTETFIAIGTFDSRDEAENCLAYIKSKFARAMLGILKATQSNTADKWAKVPLQDFSAASDIDWRGDVDGQLYRKYGLSDAEINFIDSHVKAMS